LATYIRDLIRNNNLDFVCFQETMVKDLSKACLRGVDPGKDYLWDQIPTKGKSGGIVTGIKLDSFDVGCRVLGSNWIALMLGVECRVSSSFNISYVIRN
jgi:hypothetical protein